MRKNVIAVLMIASAFSSVVRADLSSTDQNIVDNYILKNPSIPSDKIQAIRGMDNLQSIEDYLKGNTYWNGTKNVGLPLLDFSDDKPVAPQNPSETQQQGNSTQVPQNQQEIDELNLHKQEQIEQAAERQRQADIQQALLDAHNQEQINTTVDNKLQTTQALDNKQTQDIDHNAATIADNTKYIGQVEHDADTRAQNQEQINTAVDNKLQATQALDNNQTQDIDHNAAAIADNTNHIGQVEHDADTRAQNQEQINTAVDNKLQATQALDNKQTQDIDHNAAAIADNTNHIGQVEHDADTRAQKQEQINTAVDNKLQATQALDNNQTQDIDHNAAAIADNTNHIGQVEHDADTRAHNQEQINTAVDNKLQATQALDNKQTQDIDHNAAAIADNTDHIDEVEHHVGNNSAAIAQNEQRIEKLEASNNENFSNLKNQVDENRQRASAAISGVAAMANIPQVIQGQTFSVGAGVGTTDGESALAVGFSARAAEHVVVKASVSNDTQQNFVVGGGVSYGW